MLRHAERALRKQLQDHFGVDMTDRKALIREEACGCSICGAAGWRSVPTHDVVYQNC
jgi:DEK C terminal domain